MPPNSQGLPSRSVSGPVISESEKVLVGSVNVSNLSTPTKNEIISNGTSMILSPSSHPDFSNHHIAVSGQGTSSNSSFLGDQPNSSSSMLFSSDSISKQSSFVPSNVFHQNQDLDIIGALGNLDLDFELSKASNTHVHSQMSTPMQPLNQNTFTPYRRDLYEYPPAHHGSLTPNPVGMGYQFPNTPNSNANGSQWGNTMGNIPASAPPFNHTQNMSLPHLQPIRPFHLPDEPLLMEDQSLSNTLGGNNSSDIQNNGGPFHSPYGGLPGGDYNTYGLRAAPPLRERRSNYNSNVIHQDEMHFNQGNPMWNQNNMRNHPLEGNDRRWFNNSRNEMNVHRKLNFRRKGEDASKFVNARLEDFTGDIYSLCKDQHGCRFLQRQLDAGSEIASTLIFNEIYLHMIELMTDPFGNYLIQKLLEKVSTDQRIILVKNASPEFIRIALDPHGTRALQKLVECINTAEESKIIIESLSPHIVPLSRDLNGNHVVQKCLQKLKSEDNQFIFDTASEHCMDIATHRHGCCVLQRCLDHGSKSQCKQLASKVSQNCLELSLDPFGNYVVQYVLSRGDQDSITSIINEVKKDVISLSTHKFGSNVIEKSLRLEALSGILIKELLINKDQLSKLLHDAFGNYVLQTSLDVATPDELNKLAAALKPLLPTVRNTPHGRRILSKIQSCLN